MEYRRAARREDNVGVCIGRGGSRDSPSAVTEDGSVGLEWTANLW